MRCAHSSPPPTRPPPDPSAAATPFLKQFLYYFSSFWGQFGPNATTWLLPAEVVPTEMRAMCHGFAAAVGKAGALVAGVVFNLVDDRGKCERVLQLLACLNGVVNGRVWLCVANTALENGG